MERICAKNNLAYYYALKHQQEPLLLADKQTALNWAEEAYKKYDKTIKGFDDPELVETYIFVKARFAETKEERNKVRGEIQNLIGRDEFLGIKKSLEATL